jgi:hypothetical protein
MILDTATSYHWLLGDSTYYAGGTTYTLPLGGTRDHAKPKELESLENFSGTFDPDEAKAPTGRALARGSSPRQSEARRF